MINRSGEGRVAQPNFKAIRIPLPRSAPSGIKPFNLELPHVKYPTTSKSAAKVLVVMERTPRSDLEERRLLNGGVGTTFWNILNEARTRSDRELSELVVMDFLAYPPSAGKFGEDSDVFMDRVFDFADRFKPDCVLFLGVDAIYHLLNIPQKSDGEDEFDYRFEFNRFTQVTWGTTKYPVVYTLRLNSLLSGDVEEMPGLFGYVVRGLQVAIEGRNRYDIDLSQSKIKHVLTIKEFDRFYNRLLKAPTPAIDVEGTNLNRCYNTKMLTIQFAFDTMLAYAIPLYHRETPFTANEIRYIEDSFADYFRYHEARYHIMHFGKLDINYIRLTFKIPFYASRVYDTSGGAYGLDENGKFLGKVFLGWARTMYRLDYLAHQHGSRIYVGGKVGKSDRTHLNDLPLPDVLDYGGKDVLVTQGVCQQQIRRARDEGHEPKVFVRAVAGQISDIIHTFVEMEQIGSKVDRKYLLGLRQSTSPMSKQLEEVKLKLRNSKAAQEANRIMLQEKGWNPDQRNVFTGKPMGSWILDINKPRDLQVLFFEVLELNPLGLKKTGDGSVDASFIEQYKGVPEIDILESYRELELLKSRYVEGHLKLMLNDPDMRIDERLRAVYDYLFVITLRSSASKPALQQIPTQGKESKTIKRQFIATEGYILIKMDYSSHEVNNWGNISNDPDIIRTFMTSLRFKRLMRLWQNSRIAADRKYRKLLKIQQVDKDGKVQLDGEGKPKLFWKELSYQVKVEFLTSKQVIVLTTEDGKISLCNSDLSDGFKKIALLGVEIDVKGDVHKQNYQFFYGVPAEKVNKEQRYNIKKTVFGVIYGLSAYGLARDIFSKIIIELRRKHADFDDPRKFFNYMRPHLDKAEELIKKLFAKFKVGGDWLKGIQKEAARNLFITSPLGFRRHLWAYLHYNEKAHKAADRRGPNTMIQGTASHQGYSGARRLQIMREKMFRRNGMELDIRHINFVHDALEMEVRLDQLILALYVIEHAATTQTHRHMRRMFGFSIRSDLQIEIEIGGSGATLKTWDFSKVSLDEIVDSSIDWMKKELGHRIDRNHIIDQHEKWWDRTWPLRKREIIESLEDRKNGGKYAAETMLLDHDMIKQWVKEDRDARDKREYKSDTNTSSRAA